MRQHTMHTQKVVLALALTFALASCETAKVTAIGQINMISSRNIDGAITYQLLRYYAGGGDAELKKSRFTTVNEAIDFAVKNVPGGEYMKNVKLY